MDYLTSDIVALVFAAAIIAVTLVIGVGSLITAIHRWRTSGGDSEKWSRAAHLMKLTYAYQANFTKEAKWFGGPFGKGTARTGMDILYGLRKTRPVTSFEYHWVQDIDGQKQSFTRMVAGAWVGGTLPRVTVTRTSMMPTPGSGITLESDDFNRRFRVESDDREAAIRLLEPRLLAYVLQAGDRAPSFWFENGWAFTAWDVTPAPQGQERAQTAMWFIAGIADLIPNYLRTDHELANATTSQHRAAAATDLFPFLAKAPNKPQRESLWGIIGESIKDTTVAMVRRLWEWNPWF